MAFAVPMTPSEAHVAIRFLKVYKFSNEPDRNYLVAGWIDDLIALLEKTALKGGGGIVLDFLEFALLHEAVELGADTSAMCRHLLQRFRDAPDVKIPRFCALANASTP